MIDKQRVNELALEHKANMRCVSKTLADRDALSTSEAKLPLEVFPWRQSECYTDPDMGQYDCMAVDAGHKETGKAQMEPVKSYDSSPHSDKLLHRSLRFS